jgi:outer membrane lipoprotein-sorting protein
MHGMKLIASALVAAALLGAPGWAAAAQPTQAAAGVDAAPADQAAAVLEQAQEYLNSIHTLKARFTQIAPNGAITHGTAWLDRPGRMRFQYDPPTPLLLVAGHGFVLFRDTQLGQTSTVPTDRTPLGILLASHIELTGGDLTVTAVRIEPGQAQITLARKATPSEGSLTLAFNTKPWSLTEWTVTDAQTQKTTVVLTDVQTGVKMDQALFEPVAPMTSSPNNGGGG